MTGSPPPEFSETSTRRTLATACSAVGLAPEGARLLRLGENAIYALDAAPVVVRIARSLAMLQDVRKEVRAARWLAGIGFPATRLADDTQDEPLIVEDRHPVTFWDYIESTEPKPTIADLGRILREFHALDVPEWVVLPAFDPFARVPARLASPPSNVEPQAVTFLNTLYQELKVLYAELVFEFPPSPTHGDAHAANLMRNQLGEVTLIDLETLCFGPREWDLTLPASYLHRLGWLSKSDYQVFVDNYGFDISAWSGFEVLARIRELTMTTWLMQLTDSSVNALKEFQHRTREMQRETLPRQWRPL
jgi:aminoglycoside phosphotransferase